MKLYGLYSEKQKALLGFSVSANCDGEFCGDTSFELTTRHSSEAPWCTPSKENAEIVSVSSTEWYNASYDSPEWDSKYLGKLTVVDLSEYEEE